MCVKMVLANTGTCWKSVSNFECFAWKCFLKFNCLSTEALSLQIKHKQVLLCPLAAELGWFITANWGVLQRLLILLPGCIYLFNLYFTRNIPIEIQNLLQGSPVQDRITKSFM